MPSVTRQEVSGVTRGVNGVYHHVTMIEVLRSAKAGTHGERPVGVSPQWLDLLRQVAETIPDGDRNVLILGEVGGSYADD